MSETYCDILKKRWYKTTKKLCKKAKKKASELNLQIMERGGIGAGQGIIKDSYHTEFRLQTKDDSLLVDYLVHYTPLLPQQVDEYKYMFQIFDLNKAVKIAEHLSDMHDTIININKKSIDEVLRDHDELIDKYKQQGYKGTFQKLSARI